MKLQQCVDFVTTEQVFPGNGEGPEALAPGPSFSAERVGFEPTDHFKGGPRISSAVRSTRLRHLSRRRKASAAPGQVTLPNGQTGLPKWMARDAQSGPWQGKTDFPHSTTLGPVRTVRDVPED